MAGSTAVTPVSRGPRLQLRQPSHAEEPAAGKTTALDVVEERPGPPSPVGKEEELNDEWKKEQLARLLHQGLNAPSSRTRSPGEDPAQPGSPPGPEIKDPDYHPEKPARVRWTEELHACFVRAVDRLGGHQQAKPEAIRDLMVKAGHKLTNPQVKSHLQAYRLKQPRPDPPAPGPAGPGPGPAAPDDDRAIAEDEAIFSERAWDFQTAAEAARAKAASVPEEAAAALGAAAALRVTGALEASTPAALALTAEELAEAQAAQAVPTGPVQVPEPVAEVVDQKAVLDYLRREILGPDEEEQPAPDPADPAGGGASSEEEFALVPAAGKAPAEPPAAAAGPSFEDVPGGPGAGSAGEDDWDPKLERIDSGRRSRQRAARAAEPGAAPPAAWKTAQEDSIPSWFREKMAALASSDSESD